jgi:hypothetical protein
VGGTELAAGSRGRRRSGMVSDGRSWQLEVETDDVVGWFPRGLWPAIEVQEQEGRSLRRVLRFFFFFFFFKEEEEEEYYAAARPVEAFNAV